MTRDEQIRSMERRILDQMDRVSNAPNYYARNAQRQYLYQLQARLEQLKRGD